RRPALRHAHDPLLRPRDVCDPPPEAARGGPGGRGRMTLPLRSHDGGLPHEPGPQDQARAAAPHTPRATPGTPAPGGLDFELPQPARIGRVQAMGIGAGIAVVLAAAFVLRWLPNRHAQQALAADAREAEVVTPRVSVIAPTVVSSDRAL